MDGRQKTYERDSTMALLCSSYYSICVPAADLEERFVARLPARDSEGRAYDVVEVFVGGELYIYHALRSNEACVLPIRRLRGKETRIVRRLHSTCDAAGGMSQEQRQRLLQGAVDLLRLSNLPFSKGLML